MDRVWMRLRLGALVAAALLVGEVGLRAEQELTFPLLQIGTEYLTNATVTTRNKDYVFILHSRGMASYKVAGLPEEALGKLGFTAATQPKVQTNAVAAWAKGTIANLQTENVKKIEDEIKSRLPIPGEFPKLSVPILCSIAGILLTLHVFFSYCAMLICTKAGTEPGAIVWIPILQLVPLVRAAGMAPVWVLAFLIPVINLIAQVVWSFKISQARGKGAVVAILLLLPLTNIMAFLYLAFSKTAKAAEPEKRGPQIMTLETA
jgi:hypothetical protein